jgi:hypothetical protein
MNYTPVPVYLSMVDLLLLVSDVTRPSDPPHYRVAKSFNCPSEYYKILAWKELEPVTRKALTYYVVDIKSATMQVFTTYEHTTLESIIKVDDKASAKLYFENKTHAMTMLHELRKAQAEEYYKNY